MTELLTPGQIATIDSNREPGCTCCASTYHLLRDREAICERVELLQMDGRDVFVALDQGLHASSRERRDECIRRAKRHVEEYNDTLRSLLSELRGGK